MTAAYESATPELVPEICLTNTLEHFFKQWFPPERTSAVPRPVSHSFMASKIRRNKESLHEVFGWIICTVSMKESKAREIWEQVDAVDPQMDFKRSFTKFILHLQHMGVLPDQLTERWERLIRVQ